MSQPFQMQKRTKPNLFSIVLIFEQSIAACTLQVCLHIHRMILIPLTYAKRLHAARRQGTAAICDVAIEIRLT